MDSFRAERAVSPVDGSELWVVLDPGYVAHREASDFLRGLHGAGRSPHTIRAYAGRAALFLSWCQDQGTDWRQIRLADLARFKHWLEVSPSRGGRVRSGSTVNAVLTPVCEMLRFCARTGLIEAVVAEQLSEPCWLRFAPPGFDAGGSGQFRTVRARMLKARAQAPFPEALTAEQVTAVLGCCQRSRERFMVILLLDTGLRIGEALGLRRADMHLLPDSRSLGCATVGAHVHVRHRANPNGALAKSRFPRSADWPWTPRQSPRVSPVSSRDMRRGASSGCFSCSLIRVIPPSAMSTSPALRPDRRRPAAAPAASSASTASPRA
jgi:integrase/recombinase XerD